MLDKVRVLPEGEARTKAEETHTALLEKLATLYEILQAADVTPTPQAAALVGNLSQQLEALRRR